MRVNHDINSILSDNFSVIASESKGHFSSMAVKVKQSAGNAMKNVMDFCQRHTPSSLKERVCNKKEQFVNSAEKLKGTLCRAYKRAVIGGVSSGTIGCIATTAILGLMIGTNPVTGIPIALAAGVASSGGFAIAGAATGALWPALKVAAHRLTQQDIKLLERKISDLEFKLEEKEKFIKKVITNDISSKKKSQ